MMKDSKYQMRLNLNVLEHLGLNLYSNVPSVLAEAVSNSWDADATEVDISFCKEKNTIVIQDNGEGMNTDDVNNRFLTVGYRRRDKQPGATKKGRSPMGRKGIGKLSLFSIAEQIDVETTKGNEINAFRMRVSKIREVIESDSGCYFPEDILTDESRIASGTRITLSNLKKIQTYNTKDGLRKRLARRFSTIGARHDFIVRVNGIEITPSDRGYLEKLQYIWTYGNQQDVLQACSDDIKSEDRTELLADCETSFQGWLGTVTHSNQLKDEYGENLNRIPIFVRGKMAQENLLGDFCERGVYASYLIGELYVDELDKYDGLNSDKDEDATTSSRQSIVEDDSRYINIKKKIAQELKHIQKKWAELRSEEGSNKALEIPAINEWINKLSQKKKSQAIQWLGKINQIKVDDERERRHLWKHAIIAFEFFSWSNNLNKLETIDENNIEVALDIFNELDNIEFNLYGQIVKERVEIIRTLKSIVDAGSLEKVIQKYLFDHLWLLDPAWERVEASEFMESRVETIFRRNNEELTDSERHSRIDLVYRKTAGKHVIVELKRPSVTISVHELSAQIGKYKNAIIKLLEESNLKNESIEIVCLLGKPPREWNDPGGRKLVEDTLAAQDARWVKYDQLLNNAYQAYSDYSEKQKHVDRLTEVIKNIENFVPDSVIRDTNPQNH